MKNLVVKKPWGEEYIACKCRKTATWLLKLDYKKKTSLHCHPNKKTGFILLDGKVEIMIGFYEKKVLSAPSKLMIRPGLFHSTKALSKKGCIVLEIENPINKNDLVRYKDSYGRAKKPYESKNKMRKMTNEIFFKVPKRNGINKYNYKNVKLTIERHKNKKKLVRKSRDTIYAILDGGLVDKRNQFVLSPGDIIKTDTIKKLSKEFDIKNEITILTCKKK